MKKIAVVFVMIAAMAVSLSARPVMPSANGGAEIVEWSPHLSAEW